ncbi:hypothetical protein ACXLRP_001439 [Acinetobacter baumannii]|uniref:hypothetical protein n=3 Tax=Acinetobacter baumannii TaxID=470 RepID=UPI0002BACE8A|nr:hypothetical protein [Acinetobacter baumannii]EIO2223904.1 hypothetical protein [Acinetobacter baumannii]EKT9096186.1 hypothetical protein [Acinetobacter baumannii]EKT9795953.1 hypothetical protein [Acinetobacter baumannii]EKU0266686.1 hypothetical protein [Acinetobacter baumannii]EKU0973987.1 hypothetical protein [Acinetobacter baumannii]
MPNQTFTGSEPTWANACVGENGSPNYIQYSKGYSKAANFLLNNVLNTRGKEVDLYIYPICFNMRHSIELRIKGAIQEINELAKIKNKKLPSFDLVASHDIGNIWRYFKENSKILDIRFKIVNDKLDPTILDIAEIDSTGQTFRYPFNNKNKKHLVDQKVINCGILKIKFNELEKNLDDLIQLIESLIDEYKLGTFTTKFSRTQIFQFVKELPPINQWDKSAFIELKNKLKANYNLSNNDFSKIIDQIKNNYELSHKIGLKKNLIFLSDCDVLEICDIWITYFEPKFRNLYNQTDLTLGDNSSDPIEEWIKNAELHKKGMALLEKKLLVDYVADLQALYYLSIDQHQYSENYIFRFKYFQKEAKYNELSESLDHLLSKCTFLEELLKGLFFLNQRDLAEQIIQIYGLEPIFDFIPQARLGIFFKHFELLDY